MHHPVGCSPEQLRQTLLSLLRAAPFERAKALSSLLRFLVEAEIAGQGAALDAHRIATQGLGLPETFDPARDPTVRIQVGRLRRLLESAYAAGCEAPIRISIPSGSYRPMLRSTADVVNFP